MPGKTLFPPDTPKREIANTLNNALEKARDETTPPGKVKAITVLRNGGIIVELESEALALWLNNPAGKAALESNLDITVSFRRRTYPIVLEYLPIQTQVENENFTKLVEQENNLPPNTIASIRWIKPPTKCSAEQRKAFALMQITDIHLANNILRDGICIANDRISIHKDKKEPLRCVKCQKYNHIAKNCKTSLDICGTCGNNHRTSMCSAYHTTRCVNCRSQQHTSWSRACPEFARRCKDIDDKYPENRMPYFPTEHIWTQVSRPARSPRPTTSPHPSLTDRPRSNPPPHLRQTTINFEQQQQTRDRSPQRPQDVAIHSIIARTSSPEGDNGFSDSTPPSSPNHV
jgi:hypothetical protein